MDRRIHHTFFYPEKPEAVWDYLTRPDLMERWLMKTTFQPIIGFDFQFFTKAMPELGFDGVVHGTVLEIIPHEKLSYSWKSGPGNNRITLDSIVTWTLIARDNGTELVLDHSSFKKIDFTIFAMLEEGWLKNIKKIAELVAASK